MARKTLVFAILIVVLISLNGCATVAKQKDLEIQGLRNQISVLETQIQSKDEEITTLKGSLADIQQEKALRASKKKIGRKRVVGEVKSRPNVSEIQIALKNAGYDPGAIDGRTGGQTRDAIRAFQRANNLPVDGKVGKQTWSLLREYLYKKLK